MIGNSTDAQRFVGKILPTGGENLTMDNVKFAGPMNRAEVNELLGKSIAGLCFHYHVKNYIDAIPTKMFEYFAAGIPCICSDIPILQGFIDDTHAGICVPVRDVNALREAIVKLLTDRELAQEMGRNGRRAVEEKYNWDHEAEKLIDFYRIIEEDK